MEAALRCVYPESVVVSGTVLTAVGGVEIMEPGGAVLRGTTPKSVALGGAEITVVGGAGIMELGGTTLRGATPEITAALFVTLEWLTPWSTSLVCAAPRGTSGCGAEPVRAVQWAIATADDGPGNAAKTGVPLAAWSCLEVAELATGGMAILSSLSSRMVSSVGSA